jgi:hypothetical protein
MKTITLLLLLGLGVLFASAQERMEDDDEITTIFSKNKSNGGYGALSFSWTEIENKNAFLVGARGAWIIDHSFAIGLGGCGFINDIDHHDWMDNTWQDGFDNSLAGGYGGIYLEPIVGPRQPVHLSFPILIGAGGVARVANDDYWDNRLRYNRNHEDAFFIVEPSVELEFNMTRFMRMAGTLSYRFTSDIKMENTDPELLRGLSAGLIFKFGKF